MKILRPFSLIFLCSLFFCSCGGDDTIDCIPDPVPNDYVEPENDWMIRHNIGDTLLFNRYHVDTDTAGNRKYRYTGQEQYVATDTGTVKIYEINGAAYDECNEMINRYAPTLTFQGQRKLQVQIKPQGSFDWLNVYFAGNEFRIDNDQYNYPGNFYSKLNIDGKEFLDVNRFHGFIEGNWAYPEAYVDSTYVFYNYDYGLVKFIINDTLVFQRVINK